MLKRRSFGASGSRKSSGGGSDRWQPKRLWVEWLETRSMLSASTLVATPNLVVTPNVTSTTPYGYTPAQIDAAYGFGLAKVGSATLTGAGQTIAIVDAYNDPNIKSDLAAFDVNSAWPPRRTFRSSTKPAAQPSRD